MKKKLILIAVLVIALIAGFAIWKSASHKTDEGSADVEVETETAEDENIPEDTLKEDPDDLTEDSDISSGDDNGNGISFEEEDDNYVIKKVKRDKSDFYGNWEATSDMAEYMYGGVEVTVNKDGTWSAKITGVKLGGTYDVYDDHLHMNDTVEGIFDFDLAYDKGGKLIMIDSDSEDGEAYTVLTKK